MEARVSPRVSPRVSISPYNVERWLASLGSSPLDVADSLRQLRARGIRDSTTRCPLARALETRGCQHVRVYHTLYRSWAQWCDEQGRSYELALPRGCWQFVKDFDAGKYPDLDEKGESHV
jgi:hypothetical protein